MNYLNAPSGKIFEERVMVELKKIGYNRILKNDLNQRFFSELKNRILHNAEFVVNETEFNQHYLYQPFGSQSYPDFIILDTQVLICIESKYTEKKKGSPVWNSGLPRANGLFIFGSWGKKDITFFRGCDVISEGETQHLREFFAKEKERAKSFNEQFMSNQEYGFAAYVRTAYEQKKIFNDDAIINFFENNKRSILEDSVLTYLQQI